MYIDEGWLTSQLIRKIVAVICFMVAEWLRQMAAMLDPETFGVRTA